MNFRQQIRRYYSQIQWNGCIKACCVFMYLLTREHNNNKKFIVKRKAGKFTTRKLRAFGTLHSYSHMKTTHTHDFGC